MNGKGIWNRLMMFALLALNFKKYLKINNKKSPT